MSDGNGGAVFGLVAENGSNRNTYIQHVLSNGTFKFAAPVAAQNTATSRIRVLTAFTYNAATGQYFQAISTSVTAQPRPTMSSVFKRNTTVSDGGPTLDWGSDGAFLSAQMASYESYGLSLQPTGDGCFVNNVWLDNTTRGYVYAAKVVGTGTIAWNEQIASTYQGYSNRNDFGPEHARLLHGGHWAQA